MLNVEIRRSSPIPKRLAYLNDLKSRTAVASERFSQVGLDKLSAKVERCGDAVKISSAQGQDFHQLRKGRFCRAPGCPLCDAKWAGRSAYQISKVFGQSTDSIRLVELSFSAVDIPSLKPHLALLKKQKQQMMQRAPFKAIAGHAALFRIEIWASLAIVSLCILYRDSKGKYYISKKGWQHNGVGADITEFAAIKPKDLFVRINDKAQKPYVLNVPSEVLPQYLESIKKFRFLTSSKGLKIESKPKHVKGNGKTQKFRSHWYGYIPNPDNEGYQDEYLRLDDFDPAEVT